MAFRLTNPLRAVWRYMRAADIHEANARILARNQAERAAAADGARAAPGAAAAAARVTVTRSAAPR